MNKWRASPANPLGNLTTAPHRIVPYGTGVVEIGVARIVLTRFSPAAWNGRRATGEGSGLPVRRFPTYKGRGSKLINEHKIYEWIPYC